MFGGFFFNNAGTQTGFGILTFDGEDVEANNIFANRP
jgi:hypothetical protein